MKNEDSKLSKQGSTSSKPDSHTHVSLNHLNAKNHGMKPHTLVGCGDEMKWRQLDEYKNRFNNAFIENKNSLENIESVSKKHDNLTGSILVELETFYKVAHKSKTGFKIFGQ